jgi:hypothetical protein
MSSCLFLLFLSCYRIDNTRVSDFCCPQKRVVSLQKTHYAAFAVQIQRAEQAAEEVKHEI